MNFMTDKEYFSHLYEIASHLNREFSLPSALRKALEKTVELLNLETGWIWLVQRDNLSVYLAASYNLPPALSDHPERLSGWCYCIEKYLTSDMDRARNISEITCSRLKDIKTGTRDLKFHATIPITISGQKIGIINLVSKETQQLDEKQLSILNTISELVGIAIQRTRLQESYDVRSHKAGGTVLEVLDRVVQSRLKNLLSTLESAEAFARRKDLPNTLRGIGLSLDEARALQHQLSLILEEKADHKPAKTPESSVSYPASPLTGRELEVLTLVRKGLTNRQIAEQLYIAERTVKFHLTSIMSKLYAGNRTEAVDTALKRGLLGV